jgi:hypothetical protein
MQSEVDFNGRVIRVSEYAGWDNVSSCVGAPEKRTYTAFDQQKLGMMDSTSYGNSDDPTEAGSVKTIVAYDNFGRAVSTQRCVQSMAIGVGVVPACKIEQQAFDKYGRSYWGADASSDGLLHGANPYAGPGFRRGTQMIYSVAGTIVDSVEMNPGFQIAIAPVDDVNRPYYQVLETNARGQVTKERAAGQVQFTTARSYEASTGRLLGINTGTLQKLTVTYN